MSSPAKTSAVGGDDDNNDVPHNTNNNNTNTMMTNAIATGGGIGLAATMTTMTPAQHQIWQQQQQQIWQQQQMYLWQQQQFAIAATQKREGGHRHHHSHHRGGMEPYRAHAQAQHNEGQAWAAAKANGGHPGLISASTSAAPVTATDQDGGAVKTTQYIKRGEEGNDGTGLRGTSKTTCEDGDGPRYVYRDFSHLPHDVSVGQTVMSGLTDGSSSIGGRKTIGEIRQARLPAKLEHMLSDPSFASIVGWMPHGRAWKVFQPQEFTERVLPLYFESSKYSSFIRIVNAWGFRRFSSGPDANAYYHGTHRFVTLRWLHACILPEALNISCLYPWR